MNEYQNSQVVPNNNSKALWQVINSERKTEPDTNQQWKLMNNHKTMQDTTTITKPLNNFSATNVETHYRGLTSVKT